MCVCTTEVGDASAQRLISYFAPPHRSFG